MRLRTPKSGLGHCRSNVGIQEGETRYSFTQYTAGGLFRWRARGLPSQKRLLTQGGKFPMDGWTRSPEGMKKFSASGATRRGPASKTDFLVGRARGGKRFHAWQCEERVGTFSDDTKVV